MFFKGGLIKRTLTVTTILILSIISLTTVANAENLVTNGDFSNGATGWTYQMDGGIVGGSYANIITPGDYLEVNLATGWGWIYRYQYITYPTTGTYTLQFDENIVYWDGVRGAARVANSTMILWQQILPNNGVLPEHRTINLGYRTAGQTEKLVFAATSDQDGGRMIVRYDNIVVQNIIQEVYYNQQIVVFDDESLDWIPSNITVTQNGVSSHYSSLNGYYNISLIEGKTYSITATSDGYDSNTVNWNAVQPHSQWNLPLHKQYTCAYDVQVVDSSTGALVEGSTINVYDNVTGTWYNYTSPNGLMNLAPIIKGHQHTITITKAGYQTYVNSFIPSGDAKYPVVLLNQQTPAEAGKCYLTLNVVNDQNGGSLYRYTVVTSDNQVYNAGSSGYTTILLTQGTTSVLTVRTEGFYAKDYVITPSAAVQTATVRLLPLPAVTATPTSSNSTNLSLSYDSAVFVQRYKGYVNNTCNYTFGAVKMFWNNTLFNTIGQYNDTLNQRQALQEQYYSQTDGFKGVFAFFGLIFGMFPFEVKSLIIYYFMWVGFLILMGK